MGFRIFVSFLVLFSDFYTLFIYVHYYHFILGPCDHMDSSGVSDDESQLHTEKSFGF